MERKLQIPKMSNEEIRKWYGTIKPIVTKTDGKPRYLRNLSEKELTDTAYTWLNEPTDFSKLVDLNKLSILADVKMLHKFSYYGFFKPSVEEVIRQIPKEFIEKVIAFEILAGGIGMNTVFNEEFKEGFHVSIVRLYQAKSRKNTVSAKHEDMYPTNDSKVPIGMTGDEFRELKRIFGIYE